MMAEPRPKLDLAPFFLEYPTAPVTWAEVFGNTRPVQLEVGPGKGLFLANAAVARPDHNFIGIEVARKYARKAAERVARRDLRNVRLVAGDAKRFLKEFVPPTSLAAVHVYFPDPWWKKRHKKRRVFTEDFVNDVARSLPPHGDLWIATDVEEYFLVMQEIMSERSDFEAAEVPELRAAEHELDYLTNFERKYRLEGRPIYRAHYRRT